MSRLILIGWTGFLAENLILSENRTEIINQIGDDKYHMIYNSLSTIACGTIAYGFLKGRNKGYQVKFINPNTWGTKTFSFLTRSLGLIGISQSLPALQIPLVYEQQQAKVEDSQPLPSSVLKARCPIDFGFDKQNEGLKRVTRHPMLFSLASLSLSFALRSNYLSNLVFFGFPSVFAIVGGAHQDYRYSRGIGGTLNSEQLEKTSLLPFIALFENKQDWKNLWKEMKQVNVFLAILLASLI